MGPATQPGTKDLASDPQRAPYGQALPNLKIYIHLWLHARDNQTILGNWEKTFKVNGGNCGVNGEFRSLVENAFGKEYATAETPVIHPCAALQFTTQKGVDITSDMSPPVPEAEK
ncbi:hypothetical protein F4803DRAFT_550589 [Xylaria telfairii]|nr:hypothetical protein F4803DRAFT_550589 [Xylaria telfairii]